MTKEQFKREKMYQVTLAIARAMFSRGLLTKDEICRIDTMMLEKYKPIMGGLRAYNP